MSTSGASICETSVILYSFASESRHTDCGPTHGDIKLAGQPLLFIAPELFAPTIKIPTLGGVEHNQTPSEALSLAPSSLRKKRILPGNTSATP